MLPEISLQQVVFRGLAGIAVVAVLGWAVAAIAGALGDRGPRHDGRLSLNPLRHLDYGGLIGAIVGELAWMLPVALNPRRLVGNRAGLVAVVVLALVAAVALAAVAAWLGARARLAFAGSFGLYLALWLETVSRVAVGFAVINLVPLPPLLGLHLLAAAAPEAAARPERYAVPVSFTLVILLLLGLPQRILAPVAAALARLVT